MRKLLATVFVISAMISAAWAGTGAGAVNDVTGTGASGFDVVSYFEPNGPVQGIPRYSTTYQGVPYLFATAEHLQAFTAHPERYAPQYGGFCSVATAFGSKATIDPHQFKIVNDKLYLNHSEKAQQFFEKDTVGVISKADANWKDVQKIDGPSH